MGGKRQREAERVLLAVALQPAEPQEKATELQNAACGAAEDGPVNVLRVVVDARRLMHYPRIKATLKERVDQAHQGDGGGADQESQTAFAPGFVPEHKCSP